MIWLFPLYLLGAAAIVAPILMHLRRRPPQNHTEFSSLMFLEAQTPVPVSKRRLEHWLLLLLRCLVLLLLALMFARPLWHRPQDGVAATNEATVILLDRSASMRRGDLWQQAIAEAKRVIGNAKPDDRIAIAAYDEDLQEMWSFQEDGQNSATRVALTGQKLAALQPGWGKTLLGSAMIEASGWHGALPADSNRSKRLVVITDLQEGSQLETLRSVVWPEDIAVTVVRLNAPNGDNFSLALANAAADESPPTTATAGAPAAVRVRLANAREAKSVDFTLAWEGAETAGVRGYLPPGATRVLTAPPNNDGSQASVLRIQGDAWDFDNAVHIAPRQPRKAQVVYLGDERTRDEAASPLYYLSRALQPTAAIAPDLIVIPSTAPTLPTGADLVFASGSPPAALRAYAENGGLAVVVVESTEAQDRLRELTGVSDLVVKNSTTADYRMLGQVNAEHPLLRPFTDPRLRDFTKLRFWKHRHIELGPEAAKKMEVIAKFDDGSPAMVSCSIGKGSLVLLASGWHPADSQLALSTKFVPLLYGWLEAAGFEHVRATSLAVGEPVPAAAGAIIDTPDRQTMTIEADQPLRTTLPGFYTVRATASTPATTYAVNLAPEESRVSPLEVEALRDWGIRLEAPESQAVSSVQEKQRLAAAEEETRQRAWLWILAGVLAILAAETWLAGRIKTRGELLVPGT